MSENASLNLSNQPVVIDQLEDGIATLTMNRPDKRNCLNEALLDGLQGALEAHNDSPDTRVIIIAAEGPVFSAGHDMKEVTDARTQVDGGEAFFNKIISKSSAVMKTIIAAKKPVIAQIQGTASAAGLQLVASCDLAVSVDHAKFITPGVDIGVFCSTPMVALSRNVPRKQAMEMLLLGDQVSAGDARDLGLINWVVSADELRAKTLEIAHKIASKSALVIEMGKQAFYQQLEMPLNEAYTLGRKVMAANMLADDGEEGMRAFLEKRHPRWRDN